MRPLPLISPRAETSLAPCVIASPFLKSRLGTALLEAFQFRGARDRNDPWLLREQPRERERLSEASATSLMCSGRLSRPACFSVGGSNLNPNFVAITTCPRNVEGFAYELFVRERTVGFGGIEEGDASFDRRANQRDHLLLVRRRTVPKAHSHTAQPNSRDFQLAFPQFALLRC
jgi:hypothetical protein